MTATTTMNNELFPDLPATPAHTPLDVLRARYSAACDAMDAAENDAQRALLRAAARAAGDELDAAERKAWGKAKQYHV